ncbi:arginine--tRNA ligase [Sediminispirochaeta smaragdinae]|uniref:Arginine--tRNA ligase n=1 Tax=Sediminispirochaeta smaragdinae (strain DSM 11293 / JCM 15392 / SEBR 4228) TaxID=573413 RepID=E1R6A9_SEDSS|nr:arginine--tRNA ligase [Sediminispirochaeta smaragdinae]ADK80927.1 arginyl-tRNA synthetase [Sediminispirochaeta smaragdinae DSM 11293]
MADITDTKTLWKGAVADALFRHAESMELSFQRPDPASLIAERPPKPEMGDLAFPMFPFAKLFRTSPMAIASAVADHAKQTAAALGASGEVEASGPYVNVRYNLASMMPGLLKQVFSEAEAYGKTDLYAGEKIMIEFSCPNTNKPLHLGHLRNDALGESVSRILKANGADVRKVNLINDRGIHICKSMLAYSVFGKGKSPESEGCKGDHFVGDYYVKYNSWAKEEPEAEERARELLRKWEAGDPETVELWKTMNRWTIDGIGETYRKTGISFDDIYYESKTYSAGRDEVLKGLRNGVFYKEEDGSVWVDLAEINLDKKVLLRSDGTTLYLTQDIGTAIARHGDWPFKRLIYVVASEQQYHFKVLFHVLKKLGFDWAENLYHLSYGMVNLPEGKMKSREGTVVDADDLIAELSSMAAAEIKTKGREGDVGDVEKTAEAVGLAALNYYLLQISPAKDMIFDPKESISFNGNTGPYLQYMGARISSMLRKFEERSDEFKGATVDPSLITTIEERELIKLISLFPEKVAQAGAEFNPSIVTTYLYDLSRTFSRYYHDNQILNNDDKNLAFTRLSLAKGVLQVLKNAYWLVGIPFLEVM